MLSSSSSSKPLSGPRLLEPAPHDLRMLVLDYLSHNTYSSTARIFMRDSAARNLDTDGDETMSSDQDTDALEERLAGALPRKEIRTRILSGQVDAATELLNKYFPSVLAESTENGSTRDCPDRLEYVPPASVKPSHLSLNLRILAFIEAARTIPLPYYPPNTESPPASETPDEDVDMSREDSEQANVELLHRAQSLYSEANRLPVAEDRERYRDELLKVGGLLAYAVPERSPMRAYMTQAGREAVADQIDGAILYRTGQPVVSRLELAARQMSVVWPMMHELGVELPPVSTWPAAVVLPGVPKASSAAGKSSSVAAPQAAIKKAAAEPGTAEIAPSFDLHAFLDGSV